MSSLFVLADAGFLQDFFSSDWSRAVAQNLTAAAIAALAARAWYRQRLTDRDLELKAAEDKYQGALRKKKVAEEELAQLKLKADAAEAERPEAVLARFEKENEDGNYLRAKRELQEWFDAGRQPIATIAGELGEWYLSFKGGEDAGAALPRAQRFIALAKLLEPENARWDLLAEELGVATVLDALKAGRFYGADDGFDDSTLYAIIRDPSMARGTIEQCLAIAKTETKAGHYASAYLIARRALRLANLALMPNEPLSLAATAKLAGTLLDLGRFAEAEPLCKRVLEARERVLGAEHPDTLRSLSSLARLYKDQGRYIEAEPLYERALEACERVLGAEHPDTLASMTNLAALYWHQDRFGEAEPLYERALEASERVLGAEHPATLLNLDNLGRLLGIQCLYGEAEPLIERALEAQERVLGAEHPDTFRSLNILSMVYGGQGRYSEAEPLSVRAVQGAERVLGPEHPYTLACKQLLAEIRADQTAKEDVGAS